MRPRVVPWRVAKRGARRYGSRTSSAAGCTTRVAWGVTSIALSFLLVQVLCGGGSAIHVMLMRRFHVTVRQHAVYWHGGQQNIMVIREVCPRCKSSQYKKNGHIHNG